MEASSKEDGADERSVKQKNFRGISFVVKIRKIYSNCR
jgi:hypothetical protein